MTLGWKRLQACVMRAVFCRGWRSFGAERSKNVSFSAVVFQKEVQPV